MADFAMLAGGFGDLTGWDLQSQSGPETSERAQMFSATGNESASELFDARRNWTTNYKANKNYAAAAPTIPASIGAVVGAALCTSIAINTTYNDFATMTLSGHEHVDGTDGTSLRSVAHELTLTKGFGADSFDIVAGGDSLMDCSVTIVCDHAETKDKSGNTSQGENHNPRIEVSATVFGTDPTVVGYDEIEVDDNASENTGFQKTPIRGILALAFSE